MMFVETVLGWFKKKSLGPSQPADTPGLCFRLELKRPHARLELKKVHFRVEK
jgi:hypothetical protein